mmetsp:Transcript_123040/g.244907  ORF Transcript_123040/g.244907 Transcript_123040/m.244907 type:complete len:271 (-) Transcript_123040:29-841(-)
MGAALAKDEDDEFADLGAKVTGASPSVAASRTWLQERSGISELSTAAPSNLHLELPVLEPEATMTTEEYAVSPREANQSALLCAPNCEAAQALAEAVVQEVQASTEELPRWGSADSFRLLCSGIADETEVTKDRCPFQVCHPSGCGNRWEMSEEVVECEEMEGSLAWHVPRGLTPRQRLALDAVPRSSGNGNGYVQPMALTHEPLQSNRGIKNHQENKEVAAQMRLAAVTNHQRAEEAAWAAARKSRRANTEAGGASPRRQKAGWVTCLF